MPAAVHAPLINHAGFMFKERNGELPAFTAVNGRTSPLSPRKLNAMNGMSAGTIHTRPYSRESPEQPQDPKAPVPSREEWGAVRPATENGHKSVSPTLSDEDESINSPTKRKRSSSAEEVRPYPDPSQEPTISRPRLDSYAPQQRGDSPNTIAQVRQLTMEHTQSRTLPPLDRTADSDRAWPPPRNGPHNNYHEAHHRDPRPMEPSSDAMNRESQHDSQVVTMEGPNGFERSSTTEMTRAGVQVDPKKRKRQFANRTKTGCGTCRRRKKKCDEAKPECKHSLPAFFSSLDYQLMISGNNCIRGGFICEGYANKIPWPKNGVQKPHPPLQAKDRYQGDHSQLYHSHGNSRESYSEQSTQSETDGARSRPIVEEQHRQQPRLGWNGGWSEPVRASYPPEQQQKQPPPQPQPPQHAPPEYSQPPPQSSHGGPPSNDQQSSAQTPPSRQHNPRIYHHTPQTMSQVVHHSPAVTAEAALHHQAQSQPQSLPHHSHAPPMAPLTAAPPVPPPSHYAPLPPRPLRSEKEKMLSGEPFQPFNAQLVDERERCKAAVYRFNNTDNPQKDIARESRDNLFRAILVARWTLAYSEPGKQTCGHFGREGVHIDAPFMCDYGYNLSIGDNVDIGTGCRFLDSGRITVGRNSSIGANVTIDTQKTPQDPKTIKGSRRSTIAAEVHIGENVHIGVNCTILAGVRIGSGAIIHPGSVVVRDVPPNSIARGPAADYV
ncbi:hypothetical protein P280DRAFT_163341 [Massarina eburnea CBS 473.64]|uniref:Uncharacterized protein n=1 Tax=Massarina eburnea CBS 473.64 TaxID=1395130 RepID=A0A6A6RPE3_9PLEO|nr:hypothetical protein P280DRAFT_163341 [Massarina eburnea CBS 473.64]